MANMNDFLVELITTLNTSQAISDINKLQKELEKKNINLNTVLNTTASKQELQNFAVQIQKEFSKHNINIDTSKILSSLNEVIRHAESAATQIQKIQLGIDTDKYSSQVNIINTQLSKFGSLNGEIFTTAKNSANELSSAYKKMKDTMADNTADDQKKIKAEEEYHKALAKTQNLLKQLKSDKNNEIVSVGEDKRINLIKTLNNYLAKNTAMTKENKVKIQEWINTLSSSDDMTIGSIKKINNEFKNLDYKIRKTNQLGLSWIDKLKKDWDKIGGLSLSAGVMMTAWNKTKESVAELKDLDNILTEISKTSDLTDKSLKQLGNDSFDAASKYGRTASDYLSGVESMSQSGFYGEQGTAMAEQSLLAQSAGDMAQEIADKYVIATNAAYKFNGSAEKINAVLDGMNSITNRNSVAMADMATAMTEAGTVASSYRISIEDLSAMIGTIESVTKLGGSEVGNALKAILINLQNVTSSKIVDTLDAANASMTETVNGAEKLRNPIDILRDLAKTFNQLDEDDPLRAEILTNIGQKYHAQKLGALLQNMDMFDKMLVDYSEGEGSALEESNKSAQNLTGTLNKLSNSWSEFVNSIVNSDALKTGVNFLNSLVQGATSLTKFLTPLGSIGFGAGLFASVKNIGKTYKCTDFKLNCFEYALHA